MASRLLWPEKIHQPFFKPNFIDRFHVFHHSTGTLGIPKDNILTLEEAPKPEGSEAVELKSTNLEHLVLKAAKLMQQRGGHLPLGFFWKAGVGKVMGLKLLRLFTFFWRWEGQDWWRYRDVLSAMWAMLVDSWVARGSTLGLTTTHFKIIQLRQGGVVRDCHHLEGGICHIRHIQKYQLVFAFWALYTD